MRKTTQKFTYKLNGEDKHFLLMPDEHDFVTSRLCTIPMRELFERLTGKIGATEIKLHQTLYETGGDNELIKSKIQKEAKDVAQKVLDDNMSIAEASRFLAALAEELESLNY
jgi:hypothetical protein